MDSILSRLWTLANEDHDPQNLHRQQGIVAEAYALWKALDALLATLQSQDLRVGDGTFTKLMACIRTVLSAPEDWQISTNGKNATDQPDKGVLVYVNRVLLKLGSRGERERNSLANDGIVELLVRIMQTQQRSPGIAASALQVLHMLVFDTKQHPTLDVTETLPLCLSLMQTHIHDQAVQLLGCKFLQHMAYDEERKDTILRLRGMSVVLDALSRFPQNVQLAISVLDLLYLLSVDLENRIPGEQQLCSVIEDILQTVMTSIQVHKTIEQVQMSGIVLLNSLIAHPHAKWVLCTKDVWTLATRVLDRNDKAATTETLKMLEKLLADPTIVATLENRISTEMGTGSLTTLWEKLVSSRGSLVGELGELAFISNRLQHLINITSSRSNGSTCKSLILPPDDNDRHHTMEPSQSLYEDDDEIPVVTGARHYDTSNTIAGHMSSQGATKPSIDFTQLQTGEYRPSNLGHDDNSDVAQQLLEKIAQDEHDGSLFEKFLRDTADLLETPSPQRSASTLTASSSVQPSEKSTRLSRMTNGSNQLRIETPHASISRQASPTPVEIRQASIGDLNEATQWQQRYDVSAREFQALREKYRILAENYKIVTRRACEQSKLLATQNSRIQMHMEIHQQVLDRLRTLENTLADTLQRLDVEHELRLAEVTQSTKLANELHDARKEIKALSSQYSSSSRELMQKEKLRIDYQQKASEIKQLKQKIELERDDAVIQVQTIKFEKGELLTQLEQCRREGFEGLQMREEDMDAPKPRIFSEFGRSGARSISPPKFNNLAAHQRRGSTSSIDQRFREASVQSMNVSSLRSVSTYAGNLAACGSESKEQLEIINRQEIERTFNAVYESLDASLEGYGVHITTVRRFFIESGIIQPPMVAGDVDVILAKVLAQAQETRKRLIVRKDYAFAATAPPPNKTGGDTTKFRYFDQEMFNEALTLVGMKRYSRWDIKRVLQTIVTDYLHPMQQRMRAANLHSTHPRGNSSTPSNRSSFAISAGLSSSGASAPGASSPSSICIVIMRAILNGLALHAGQTVDTQPRQSDLGMRSQQQFPDGNQLNPRKHKREDVIYSMLEMQVVLAREQKPLATICEFYSTIHHQGGSGGSSSAAKDELLGLSFELVLNFAMDFEIIPSFMDRVSLRHLYSGVSGLIKSYFAQHKKFPHATDTESLKKVAFILIIARLAIELFSAKVDYETPERQITGLLQWLDNSAGREKIMRKATLPLVIRFSRKLYALRM